MFSLTILQYVIAVCAVVVIATSEDDGKWHPEKYGGDGRYLRPRDEGKYVHVPNPYIHIPNPYIHIDNPYNGGFGQYVGELKSDGNTPSVSLCSCGNYYTPAPGQGQENNGLHQFVLNRQENAPGFDPNRLNENRPKDGYIFDFISVNKIDNNDTDIRTQLNSIDDGAGAGSGDFIDVNSSVAPNLSTQPEHTNSIDNNLIEN